VATAATTTGAPARTRARRLPRTTGALSGLLIILLGLWGALIPLVGPYFHYAFGGYSTWHVTGERVWLNIVPGVVAVLGGWLLLTSARRVSGILGGWLAIAAGAWFVVGPVISLTWHKAGYPIGVPAGGHLRQAIEWLGYYFGLGVLIAVLAAFATGRFVSRPRIVEEGVVAAEGAAAGVAEHRERRRAEEAGTVAGGGAVANREPVADREPMGDREPVAEREPVANREPVAERADTAAAPGAGAQRVGSAGTAGTTEFVDRGPGARGEAGTTETGRRRRGGLLARLRGGSAE
jgi:hypothetical protein